MQEAAGRCFTDNECLLFCCFVCCVDTQRLKAYLKKDSECSEEWADVDQPPTKPLNQVLREIYIIDKKDSGKATSEHEISQIQTAFRETFRPEAQIPSDHILEALPGEGPIKTVMMKGVAGTGKTVEAQKFAQDWAEGKTNQNIDYVFPITFRCLNSVKDKEYSLMELLKKFFVEINAERICQEETQIVFILDGLDEWTGRRLRFQEKDNLSDVTERTSVDVVLTNLIKGILLPSARILITTRPAAAGLIPRKYIDRMTELTGFSDLQKEEFFQKRFVDDEEKARTISQHLKKFQSLYIMCYLPVFCWIAATVLENILGLDEASALPKTMTVMYFHFVTAQFKHQNVKMDGHFVLTPDNIQAILSLGKLAFEQLKKGKFIFYESDLIECGINMTDAYEYSGLFRQMFKVENGLDKVKVFSFVHLSVQEFLAALYVSLSFENDGIDLLTPPTSTFSRRFRQKKNLYQTALDEALKSPNGHLDLFLRFLLGLSLGTNQFILFTRKSSQTNHGIVEYIKKKLRENISEERKINLLHCLNELGDDSLEQEIQQYLTSDSLSTKKLSPAQWSALAFMLLSSGKELDVFDLKKYGGSEDALLRLLPVVKASKRVL